MIRMDSGGGPATSVSAAVASAFISGDHHYDWSSEENAGKWRGLFVDPLQKVLVQVHPQFTAKDDALEYVEGLLIRLLGMLTAKPAPLTVADAEVTFLANPFLMANKRPSSSSSRISAADICDDL